MVATIGPATEAPDRLAELLEAGVDVVRLNVAHLGLDRLPEVAAGIRAAAESLGRPIGILADLPGPKMRTGAMRSGGVMLEEGWTFVITPGDVEGDQDSVSSTVENLASLVDPGDEIHLGDGSIVTRVVSTTEHDVVAQVTRGGVLRSRKGLHVPGAESKIEAFTPEDAAALDVAIDSRLEFVGLSFVRDAEDVQRARAAAAKAKLPPLIVAKIETRSAIDNLDSIAAEADAVMVARGDLGIQMPLRRVPVLQKQIIRTCNRRGVPVITATEMLESMTHSALPTRAEVTDVANAVLDGSDALMLSGETAVGDYPTETVEAMASIVVEAEGMASIVVEAEGAAGPPRAQVEIVSGSDIVSWAIARSVVGAAVELKVSAILCPTRSGATPARVAAFRPPMPILGLAHRDDVCRRLSLLWGVVPALAPFLREQHSATEQSERSVEVALKLGLAARGDLVAIVGGGPEPRAGSTDYLRIVRV